MTDLAIKILTAPLGKTHLFSIGQAGFIIKCKTGKLLGIDLYLSECVERIEGHMGFKRLIPMMLSPYDIEFDYLIATHPHLDHFDEDSLPELMSNYKTKLFASVECEKLVNKLDMPNDRIIYVRPGESFDLNEFQVYFVNCDHGDGAPDAVGVVITVDGKRIYEAGDTCLRLDRTNEIGKVDVMIAPINGAFGNMNEKDCAELSKALNARLTIPCHYGMFASHGGDPGRFIEIMKKNNPENPVFLMRAGEGITL